MTPNEIRERYLSFFEERAHPRLPSASLVPENDPSLLFTGAGMNQFKDEFLGKGRRGLTCATTSQKCLRTGDLENVGRTAGHHSFFEMLGNFSFGHYFKAEAITWAWEFLTGEMGIDAEKLWVTVYLDDDEAYGIWRDTIGVPEAHIHRLGAKDNFWPADAPAKGPNGPCGPCSEIFFDYGLKPTSPPEAESNPGTDDDRFIEVWNLVFTQFERLPDGELKPLPQKNIDTGMGYERLVAVVEGKYGTMETSLFGGLLDAVARVAGRESYAPEGEDGVRFRRIADHVRAACFLVGDNVRPGNEGREYVLRRILRRAIRDGFGLGIQEPFLKRLVPAVLDAMGEAYPELVEGRELLEGRLGAEEALFRRTFANGMRRLEGAIEDLVGEGGTQLDAAVVFQLHDTFGFPVDVTAEILEERGIGFDRARYDELMEEQRKRSRDATQMTDNIFDRGPLGELMEQGAPETEFLGYGDPDATSPGQQRGTEADSRLLALLNADGSELAPALEVGDEGIVVLDRSPFYAESGGQVGDAGELRAGETVFSVTGCKAKQGYILHQGRVTAGPPLTSGGEVRALVDAGRRDAIRRNHTATHLLHKALKDQLGEGVSQAGSLVAPDRLRFDFTFDRGLEPAEIGALETAVNDEILRNEQLLTELLPVEEAKRKAVALFGEKYPDPVRVVSVGDYSAELCGGTHVRASGDIGSFRITSESSIAAGIRRVEAVTGQEAVRTMQSDRDVVLGLSRRFGVPPAEIEQRMAKMAKDLKALAKELKQARAAGGGGAAFDAAQGESSVEHDGLTVFVHVVKSSREEISAAGEALAKKDGAPVAAVIVSIAGGKVAAVVCGNAAAQAKGFDASKFIRAAGGRGGGRKHLAQGTFPGEPSVDSLLEAVRAGLQGG